MKIDATRLLPFAFLAPLAAASLAMGQELDLERVPLRGMREVLVVVEDLHATSIAAGLTAPDIKAGVERQLRERGIPAISSPSGDPSYLYLRVTTRRSPSGGYPFSVELTVREAVRLVRDPSIRTRATTWTRIRGGYLEYMRRDDELGRDIREIIRELVDRFADDFTATNAGSGQRK